MQVAASHVELSASAQRSRTETTQQSLTVWVDPPAPPQGDRVRMSVTALAEAEGLVEPVPMRETERADHIDDMKMRILALLLERLTGQPIEVFEPADLELNEEQQQALGEMQRVAEQERAGARQGWGLIYQESHVVEETESVAFGATGRIRTEDGRELNFRVDMRMDHRIRRESSTEIRMGDAPVKDPLVVDFGAPAAKLPGTRFAFDLDLDGALDAVPNLGFGSSFLVDDRNGNGVADDGSELFGPTTGDGFAELAALDGDGNGFVDEGDAAWSRLRIWEQTREGDKLVALGVAGLGALYVGRVSTPFTLRGADDQALGQMRDTGVWVGEHGGAGTLRQVDLQV